MDCFRNLSRVCRRNSCRGSSRNFSKNSSGKRSIRFPSNYIHGFSRKFFGFSSNITWSLFKKFFRKFSINSFCNFAKVLFFRNFSINFFRVFFGDSKVWARSQCDFLSRRIISCKGQHKYVLRNFLEIFTGIQLQISPAIFQ